MSRQGLDFTGLGDLAKGTTKAQWRPPIREDFGFGEVLAFDQSLTATGWVHLSSTPGRVSVLIAGMLPTYDNGKDGLEKDLLRGSTLFVAARPIIKSAHQFGADVVHESPPNPRMVKGGGSSSMMAAQSIRNAAAAEEIEITMLGAQPAKRLVCGNANAGKSEAHASLILNCLPWIVGSEAITNEAKRDALMVGLLHLHRKKTS